MNYSIKRYLCVAVTSCAEYVRDGIFAVCRSVIHLVWRLQNSALPDSGNSRQVVGQAGANHIA